MAAVLAAAAEPTCSFSMSICPADGRGSATEILAAEMRTFQDRTTNGITPTIMVTIRLLRHDKGFQVRDKIKQELSLNSGVEA